MISGAHLSWQREKWTRRVPEVEGRVASTFEEAAKQLPIVEIEMKGDLQNYRTE